MNSFIRTLYLAFILLTLLMVASCYRRPERVTIGVALSSRVYSGVELAADEINLSGGVRGTRIDLEGPVVETGFEGFFVREAFSWAKKFAANPDLIAVVGHSESRLTLASAPIYNEFGVVQIVTTATNPAITRIGEWTYRLCVSDNLQSPALASYATTLWNKRRFAILYANDDYGRSSAQLFEAKVKELGGQVLAFVPHREVLDEDDEALIQMSLADLAANGFNEEQDVFVLFQTPETTNWTLDLIAKSELTSDVLGGDELSMPAVVERATELKIDLRGSMLWLPTDNSPKAAEFRRRFSDRYQRPSDYLNAYAYDAMYLIRETLLDGRPTREGVKAELDRFIEIGREFEGVTGRYSLGKDHDGKRTLSIGRVHNNQLILVASVTADGDVEAEPSDSTTASEVGE